MGEISNDGPKNLHDSVQYLTSRVWADADGRNRAGMVLIQEQQIFAARDVQKGDARPGGYVTTGGHGGIVGGIPHDAPPLLTYLPGVQALIRLGGQPLAPAGRGRGLAGSGRQAGGRRRRGEGRGRRAPGRCDPPGLDRQGRQLPRRLARTPIPGERPTSTRRSPATSRTRRSPASSSRASRPMARMTAPGRHLLDAARGVQRPAGRPRRARQQ